jgi:hypothetical protein
VILEEAKTQNHNSFSFWILILKEEVEITLFLLNILLYWFSLQRNYEQFYDGQKNPTLSSDTHERVTAVVFQS